MNFKEMGLAEPLLKAILEKGFEDPTPIQSAAIPLALAGKDIIGQAQTGTGKTAAFGLPMLNQLKTEDGIQGLVICPTRELAVQVAQEIASLGKNQRVQVLAVYGGQSIDIQIKALKKHPQIVVGTPGRLLDHLNRKTIKLNTLKYVVLDEADEMLDMGFLEDIESILSNCPTERQTFLFSATFPGPIYQLALKFMNNPENIAIKGPGLTVPLIEQGYYEVNPRQKVETLCRILDVEQPPVSMIFCRTKKGVDELVAALDVRGYSADALHGDMSQRERDLVTRRFRQGNIEILVATDVAARGLDINHVTHVINFDIPQDTDSYVHRIGRTGRAGRKGVALTLVEPREHKQLKFIERHINKKIKRNFLPTYEEALQKRQEALAEQLIDASKEPLSEYLEQANQILQENDSTYLVAAALKILANQGRQLETAQLADISGETVQVQLPLGRAQGVKPKELVNFLTAKTELTPRQIGDIEIHSGTTLVEIPNQYVDVVYRAIKGFQRNKKQPSGPKKPSGGPTNNPRPRSRQGRKKTTHN
ncbi:MAG: DEAD/DEAH box helicase [Bacillota bacterium]|nr:DEAD/DEAH box helicase [Bacillota bacterium]